MHRPCGFALLLAGGVLVAAPTAQAGMLIGVGTPGSLPTPSWNSSFSRGPAVSVTPGSNGVTFAAGKVDATAEGGMRWCSTLGEGTVIRQVGFSARRWHSQASIVRVEAGTDASGTRLSKTDADLSATALKSFTVGDVDAAPLDGSCAWVRVLATGTQTLGTRAWSLVPRYIIAEDVQGPAVSSPRLVSVQRNGWVNEPPTVAWESTDNAWGRAGTGVEVDGERAVELENEGNGTSQARVPLADDGVHVLRAFRDGLDANGDPVPVLSGQLTVRMDTTSPEVDAGDIRVEHGEVVFSGSVSDAASGVASYRVEILPGSGQWMTVASGEAPTQSALSISAPLPRIADGTYRARLIATDNAGNGAGVLYDTMLRVDRTPPGVLAWVPHRTTDAAMMTLFVDDPSGFDETSMGILEVSEDPQGNAVGPWRVIGVAPMGSSMDVSLVTGPLSPGVHRVRARLTDAQGNAGMAVGPDWASLVVDNAGVIQMPADSAGAASVPESDADATTDPDAQEPASDDDSTPVERPTASRTLPAMRMWAAHSVRGRAVTVMASRRCRGKMGICVRVAVTDRGAAAAHQRFQVHIHGRIVRGRTGAAGAVWLRLGARSGQVRVRVPRAPEIVIPAAAWRVARAR